MASGRNKGNGLFRYACLALLFLFASLWFNGCNQDELKCEGCDKDTPWSNVNAEYCYPSEKACFNDTGADCEKCR